jgi:ribosomal protein S18 acetylase RimI-like enzyme
VTIEIRPATTDDAEAVGDVWLASFSATYSFSVAHPDDDVRVWLRDVQIASGDAWVAVDDGRVVALMVVRPGTDETVGDLDQLYVDPARLGEGIGRRLLEHAKALSPSGLELFTFQVNDRARRFYERNGFVVDALGDGSWNEERQPDVRYVWRPAGSTARTRPLPSDAPSPPG